MWTVSNSSRLTATESGVYLFYGASYKTPEGHADGNCQMRFRVNGSTTHNQYESSVGMGATFHVADLGDGDYVEFQGSQATGSDRSYTASFACMKVDDGSPAFFAQASANLTLGTLAPLTWTSEIDTDNMHSASDSKVYATQAGYYLILGQINMTLGGGGGVDTFFALNGASTPIDGSWGSNIGWSNGGVAPDYCVALLDAGDYVEMKVEGTSTANRRAMAMIYLGAFPNLAYVYHSVDQSGPADVDGDPKGWDSEWFDTNDGHVLTPAPPTDHVENASDPNNYSRVYMPPSPAILVIGKLSGEGTSGLSWVDFGNRIDFNHTTKSIPYNNLKTTSGNHGTVIGFAVYSPTDADEYVQMKFVCSSLQVRDAWAVETNMYVSDADYPGGPQIIRYGR
jgi:hypothetical protein